MFRRSGECFTLPKISANVFTFSATNSKKRKLKQKFLTLIEEHKGILAKVCNMYCSEAEERRDLFQDIILQLWRAFPAYKGDSKPATWMYRIGLNVSITRLRKKSRQVTYEELSEAVLDMPEVGDPGLEKSQLLYAAIQRLTDVEKAIVMLYMDEYSYKEIADVIGISETNVGFKLSKIRAKLKNIVKNY